MNVLYSVIFAAVWTPDKNAHKSLQDAVQSGPGLDCLRYAIFTPENTKFPMFTDTKSGK